MYRKGQLWKLMFKYGSKCLNKFITRSPFCKVLVKNISKNDYCIKQTARLGKVKTLLYRVKLLLCKSAFRRGSITFAKSLNKQTV